MYMCIRTHMQTCALNCSCNQLTNYAWIKPIPHTSHQSFRTLSRLISFRNSDISWCANCASLCSTNSCHNLVSSLGMRLSSAILCQLRPNLCRSFFQCFFFYGSFYLSGHLRGAEAFGGGTSGSWSGGGSFWVELKTSYNHTHIYFCTPDFQSQYRQL